MMSEMISDFKWQRSEDFGRKKQIRSHLYKLRESRLKELYSTGGPVGEIMNPSPDLCFGKTPLTPSHGDSLVDQSFQSLKSKEVRDSESPTREIKFRNSGGVAGGVLVPDTTGWNVQTSTEVSPDGRAFRTETLAKTDGVEQLPGGRAEFVGRNEQKSSASHHGDDKNFVKRAAESSKTHLQEKIVIGDENSGRTEMKSSSVTSSSSKVVSSSSSKVISSGDLALDMEPLRLTQEQQYHQKLTDTSALCNEQQEHRRSQRNEENNTTSSNIRDTYQENKKYVDMDKSSPEYQQHVQYLMSQPGTVVSKTVEHPKPGVKMITTVKQLPDGTTVKTKRYETEASADAGSLSATLNQQSKQRVSSSTSMRTTTEKRNQDSEDVFSRLASSRDSTGPVSPRKTPEKPSQDEIYSKLQKTRDESVNEKKFSAMVNQRSTQTLRDTSQQPSIPMTSNVSVNDLVDNTEIITSKTVKKDLNQSIRNEKITSADFIQTERDRYILDRDSPSRTGVERYPEAAQQIPPEQYGRPQVNDMPRNEYMQSSKSSSKFSESRRFSTETVESYHNENEEHPSARKPLGQPKGGSPSTGRPSQDFSTHGFPSVRDNKPTQEYLSERPKTHEEYTIKEKIHTVKSDRPMPEETYSQPVVLTTSSRDNYSTNETRRHVISTKGGFSTHGFPSVRPDTVSELLPGESPRHKPGTELNDSPRRSVDKEPSHIRRSPSDGYSTHGFPSVKAVSPTDRRPSVAEQTNQSRTPTSDAFATAGFPSVKPDRALPSQLSSQCDDGPRAPNRRVVNLDREDAVSIASDRNNSITYEKKIDAAHQAFARSLRCVSPVESIRRESVSTDRQTPRTSVPSVRNSYSPSKRDGRSPSHESITNSESSRISSATVTKSHRPSTTDLRRVSGHKIPFGKVTPVSKETIDSTSIRRTITKPVQKHPAVKEKSQSAEPLMRKKVFNQIEDFLASEGVAEEPIIKKEKYYQLGPSDATLPSSRLKKGQLIGTTPTTSRRPTTYHTEDEVNATQHTTPSPVISRKSAKPQDIKTPTKPKTLNSNQPNKTQTEGYVSLNQATQITEKNNQTTNKQVSYPHYIPSASKADRSPSDRPTKTLPSTAPTTSHNAPRSPKDRSKVAPSTTSSNTKSSPSSCTSDNSTIRHTKTVKVDKATARDTTETRREPKHDPALELTTKQEDTDEDYVPDPKNQGKLNSTYPASDDEGFEPESPRSGSPTFDFEYHKPSQSQILDINVNKHEPSSMEDRPRKSPSNLIEEQKAKVTRPSNSIKPSSSKPPLDRSETFEERCRHILGMENEMTVDRTKQIQNFIDTERFTSVAIKHKPTDSSPSMQKKNPLDTVSIEDCDNDDVPNYISESGTKKNANEEYRPQISSTNSSTGGRITEKFNDRSQTRPLGYPRGQSPICSPRDQSPTEDTTVKTTTTSSRKTKTTEEIDDHSPTRPRGYPRGTSPIDKPRDHSPTEDITVKQTSTTSRNTRITDYIDDHSPTRTRDHPRGTSPTEKPRGHSPTEDITVKTTTTSSRNTKITEDIDDQSPTRPRGYPRGTSPIDKPRGPTEDITVKQTSTTSRNTRITGDIDDHSPTRPRGYPRGTSPIEKPRGPTEDITVKQKSTTSRNTRITEDIDDHSPTRTRDHPRGTSPTEKPRGHSPTEDITVKTTTTSSRKTKITEDIDDQSPNRPRGYPRGTSPIDKPRGHSPTEDITVKQTSTTSRNTRITENIDDHSPTRARDHPRGTSPTEKPRGHSPTEDITVKTTTTSSRNTKITEDIDDHSPTRPRGYPRGISPIDKPRGHSPTEDITVKTTTTSSRKTKITEHIDDQSPTRLRGYPRGTSTIEKPRGPTEDITVKQTSTTSRNTRITEDIDDHSLTRTRDHPRGTSPTEKPRGHSPTKDITVKQTSTTSRNTRITEDIDDHSPTRPRDHPRGTSPAEKPRGHSPTEDITVKTTTTSSRKTKITEDIDDQSPTRLRGYPRGTSPIDKPRGPTEDITVKQTSTTSRNTRITEDIDDHSPTRPRGYPRGTSPIDKPCGPTEDITVQTTTTSSRKTKITEDIDDHSPTRPRGYPRGTSPIDKPRGHSPTEDITVKTTTTSSRKTKITEDIDDQSPTRLRGYPRGTSTIEKPRGPTEDITVKQTSTTSRNTRITEDIDDHSPTRTRDHPRGTSPTEKPRGHSPTKDITVKQTSTTSRNTRITEDIDDHSPTRPRDHPRGTSPIDKPRGHSPTEDITVKTTTTSSRKTKITEDMDDQSPTRLRGYPRGTSPIDKPRGPTEDITVKQTSTTSRNTRITEDIDDHSLTRTRDHPRGTSPTEKPRGHSPTKDITVKQTSTTSRNTRITEDIDDHSPTRPRDHPRGTSPTEKPRGHSPTEDITVKTTTTSSRKTKITEDIDDQSPTRLRGYPRGTSPIDKPRGPTEDISVKQTSTTSRNTRITEDIDDHSPTRPRDHPRGTSPTEKPRGHSPTEDITVKTTTTSSRKTKITEDIDDQSPTRLRGYPRGTSPIDKPRGPTEDISVKQTSTTSRNTRITEDIDDHSPTRARDHPRGTSPREKPRGHSPTEDITVKTTTTSSRKTKITEDIDDQSPTRLRGYPRGTSPIDKPRGPTEDISVKQTSTTSRNTRITEDIDDHSPTRARDHPRGTSPREKPRGHSPTEDITVQTTTTSSRNTRITEDIDDRSPNRPRGYPRGTSPIDKPRGHSPTEDITVKQTSTILRNTRIIKDIDDHSPTRPRGYPRGTSPTEKPRGHSPTEDITVKTTTTSSRKTKITEDIDDQSPTRLRGYPRGTSPIDKPRGPTEDITVKQTSTTSRNTRITEDIDDHSPTRARDHPRGTSLTEKPRGHSPTEDITVKTTTTSSRNTRITEDIDDRSPNRPRGYPRGTSSIDKPRGHSPTEDITVKQTSTILRNTRIIKDIDDHSPTRPRGYPHGTSPTEKPRGGSPTKEITVKPKSTTSRNTRITEDIGDHSPIRSQGYPRGRSPTSNARDHSPTEDTAVTTTITSSKKTRVTEEIDDHSPARPRDYPRNISPTSRHHDRGPAQDFIGERTTTSVRDRLSKTFSSEKRRRSKPMDDAVVVRNLEPTKMGSSESDAPTDEEVEEVVVERTSKTTRDEINKINSKGQLPNNRSQQPSSLIRGPSPSKKPAMYKPMDDKCVNEQSPYEEPASRRPTKTTTTLINPKLEEDDLNKTTLNFSTPRAKPPTKTTTPSSSGRSQPKVERRISAELPTSGRRSKATFVSTTKATTQTTTSNGSASRQKPVKEASKKPTTMSRPSARQPERKYSPSISPDPSPSRPTSEVSLKSPHRSPNTSPSRKSPSPIRSIKLENETSSMVTAKKITVSIDKSKPKATHITTAKFKVSPPTSPTKATSSPELKPVNKPIKNVPPKPNGSLITDKITTKKVTTVRKDVLVPKDSKKDFEVPTDYEDVDNPLSQKTYTKKLPITERKESAPVHRVTKIDKGVQKMSCSTSENIIQIPIGRRLEPEPLEPIARSPSKPERRPNKHLSTKTINLMSSERVINSQDMENVVIDIQQAKSSREPSPNKIVPTPVSVDLYTGKPRYPDVVQEPEDEPRRKPAVKNIPIFEEETNDFIGCQITEVADESLGSTVKSHTRRFIDGESMTHYPTPNIVTGDNVDSECLLSVHDKVTKFISSAEEVSKPKISTPFCRNVADEEMPEDDECLLTVDEKVNKFLKTAESVTRDIITSTPKPIERLRIDDLDEELRNDECVLSVSEKVNRFTTKAKKLGPSAPQRSPELVARIERQISKQSDIEPESPLDTQDTEKLDVDVLEREEKKCTERQIDILSRPSVWDKKPKPSMNVDDIPGTDDTTETLDNVPRKKNPVKLQSDVMVSKPFNPITETVSKKKEIFENKISAQQTRLRTKPKSTETASKKPTKKQIDASNSIHSNEVTPKYADSSPEEIDDIHQDVYGSLTTHRLYETKNQKTTNKHQSEERSPSRLPNHPEIRPTSQTTTSPYKRPEDHSPSRRYSDENYTHKERSKTSEYTTRRRSSTQNKPEHHSPDCSSTYDSSPCQRKKPADAEPEDYHFSSFRETNKHHTTRTSYRSPKDISLKQSSFPDDEDDDHSPARLKPSTSSRKRTPNKVTEDTNSRHLRQPSGHDPLIPTSATTRKVSKPKVVPETVASRGNFFEDNPDDVSQKPAGSRRPSYMDHTKSSLEHTRKDSIEVTKTTFSRKSSLEDESSPRSTVKFGVGLKHKEESKAKRKLSSSDIPNIEDVCDLDLLEEMLNTVTLYEQRRRIRAQIRVVKKLLESNTTEEVLKMTKSTTRKSSSTAIRDDSLLNRDAPTRADKYRIIDDDIDSESRHIEEREEIISERSISPQMKTSKTLTQTKVTEVRKVTEPSSLKRPTPKKNELKDYKPIWATKNILKKPSENEKVARALLAKKTTPISSSASKTQQTHRHRPAADEDCITSSYGIGPTDEDGRPLFGIRALKKKTAPSSKAAQPSETTKVTGTFITEEYYSENGAEPIGERKVTVYSSNAEDLPALENQYDRRDSETIRRERLSKDGLTSVTKVQKIGKYKPGEAHAVIDDTDMGKATSKMVRRGSVKEMSEKFVRKESSSSVTEKSNNYPKAGLIFRTRTNSGATANTADHYEVRAKSIEHDNESENECDVEIRTSRKHSKVVTESEDETEIRRKVNTRSFLNSAGSKVTGVDDVLDRMRNADNVVVDGDSLEDKEARALLNKFLGASVLMSGMESIIPQKELKKPTAGRDNVKKQEVKTTRVTKTTKTATGGGSSSSPVTRDTCDFEEIWDEETLKQLLEKSTSYEERRSLRARLRQLMAEREGLSTVTTEKTETKEEDGGVVTTTTKVTTRTVTGAPKPVSPFAKFQQLDKQNSLQSPKSPLTPTTPGGSSSTPIFRFTDPALNARAATVKDQLLQWCQSKTQEYENVQITNFSGSWTDGLAFCALIHHFLPDAFDYCKLSPKQRRYNFELAFRVADEKAGIAPLLDVEDMVVMKRPDWKCVFTYVQSIYRRFRNCQ